jgi:hypothetical protein
MADTKFTALTDAQFAAAFPLRLPRVRTVATPHSVSSTTGTKVTALDMALEVGTYVFEYTLMVRSANTSDGPQLGINFSTGTAAVVNFILMFPDNTSVVTAEVHIMDAVGIKGAGFISGMAHNAYSTTSPNLGTTVGVSATATNHPCWIKGIMIVTVAGTLELWEAAESTNAATVETGSSLVVVRTV